MRAYWSHWLCGESQNSLRGRNLRSLSSTLCPLLRSSPGTRDHRSFELRSSALVKSRRQSPTTPDIITRQFRDPVHYSKHSWDEVLQDFCLLGDNFICNLLHQRQNTLHPIAKAQGHLVILVLFFQELYRQTLLLPPICQKRGHTSNVALATPMTTFAIGFNYQVSMSFSFHVDAG